MSEYRAVVKYATSGGGTLTLRSDWLPHQDMAEECIDDLRPFTNEYGNWFEGFVEVKEPIHD